MKILVAHNRYQFRGGEDAVVRDEVELLRREGHRVELLEQSNDAIHGLRGKLRASTSIFYSALSRKRMRRLIHSFQPEIVHVHNWFPLLSPSIFMEADASGIPIVQTLHNYRMLCANALLYREGAVCMDCLGKPLPLDGIIHRCYRGSLVGSAIVTAAYAGHRLIRTWSAVDRFIAVSEFERETLVRGGLPAEKIVVKPNFVGLPAAAMGGNREDAALFVGRLSPEKGVCTMLSAWKTGKIPLHLKIIGEGPMAEEVRASSAANSGVIYLGPLPPEAVYEEMAKAKYLLFPSECLETFGRTVVEAFAQGTPALASDLGGVRELVEEGVTGYRFSPGNAAALIAGASRFPRGETYERMRANCRKLYLSKFTAESNYAMLMEIYAKAIAVRKARRLTG